MFCVPGRSGPVRSGGLELVDRLACLRSVTPQQDVFDCERIWSLMMVLTTIIIIMVVVLVLVLVLVWVFTIGVDRLLPTYQPAS